jgi:hypothetical protein
MSVQVASLRESIVDDEYAHLGVEEKNDRHGPNCETEAPEIS